MAKSAISSGTVHGMPADLRHAMVAAPKSLAAWESLTPLARNEWICWVVSVKKDDTRSEHVDRTISDLRGGKRRPCCWIGCIHRTDKPMSPSIRSILTKRAKK